MEKKTETEWQWVPRLPILFNTARRKWEVDLLLEIYSCLFPPFSNTFFLTGSSCLFLFNLYSSSYPPSIRPFLCTPLHSFHHLFFYLIHPSLFLLFSSSSFPYYYSDYLSITPFLFFHSYLCLPSTFSPLLSPSCSLFALGYGLEQLIH